MNWKSRAPKVLESSLTPIPRELNELDWKRDISSDGKRLAEHVCAFSNTRGGGIFAFGVNNDATFSALTRETIEHIVTKMGNVARHNLSVPVTIDHDVQMYQGHEVLFIYVQEHPERPVFIKGKEHSVAFHRVAGHTEQMTDRQIRMMMASSLGTPFEKRITKAGLSAEEVLQLIHYQRFFELQSKKCPEDTASILARLCDFGACEQQDELWGITNMGALLFARDLSQFEDLHNRAVIVRHYKGKNNRELIDETQGKLGYAVGLADSSTTSQIKFPLKSSMFTERRFINIRLLPSENLLPMLWYIRILIFRAFRLLLKSSLTKSSSPTPVHRSMRFAV